MTQREFLYFLQTADGRFYYESGGSVSISADPKPLRFTPDGWLEIEIQRQRNSKYFALDRSFSVPLEFVRDGGLILKHFYYTKGIEEKIYLSICDLRLSIDDEFYGYYYSLLYKGEVDLSQFEHDGPKVTLNIMEGGAVKLLKANENTKYEFDLEGAEWAYMDGLKLLQSATWITGGIQSDSHTVGMTLVSQESVSSIGALTQDITRVANANPDLWQSNEFFLAIGGRDSEVTLNYDFTVSADSSFEFGNNNGVLELQLIILTSDSGIYSTQILQQATGKINTFKDVRFLGTITFTAPANSRVILYMYLPLYATEITLTYDAQTSLITANYTFTKAANYVPFLRPLDLLQRICAKMGITKVVSNTLEQYRDVVVTCGDAIRQILGSKIKTSFNDFFISYNAVLSIGVAIENDTLIFEKKDNFTSYGFPFELGECKGLVVQPAKDYIINTVKIGYPEQNYEDVNGRSEFNNTHLYTAPVTRIVKELNLVSVYRGDSYGIEFTRINLEGKTTTDSSSDNDVFFLHIEDKARTGPFVFFESFELDRSLNPFATGLLERDTVFNLWLSPKQCLFRNGAYIRSLFYQQDHEFLRFQTTEKNSEVVVSVPTQRVVSEKADVEIFTLDAPLFRPVLFEFENKLPYNIIELFKANSRRTYTFINDGVTYSGLPVKDSIKPASKKSQVFQLLSSPQNDLTQLVDYAG